MPRSSAKRTVSAPLTNAMRLKMDSTNCCCRHQYDSKSKIESQLLYDSGIWKEALPLKGTTRFTPNPQVKNILVTGGQGFIGSWLVRHLVMTYPVYNIISFDKLDYCSSLNNTRMLDHYPNFKFVHGDVTSSEDVLDCLQKYSIDTIFHLAAQSHVDLSFGQSFAFTWDNILGTQVLLDAARTAKDRDISQGKSEETAGIRRFIHVSTDEVYGEVPEDGPDLLETSKLAPTNPYAATKAAAENIVSAYSKSFGIPAIVIRSNNVYGPNQYPEKVIPKFISLLKRNRKLAIHGHGKHSRRYIYASDAVDAFDTILHRGSMGNVYNVGSRDEITNMELCAKLLVEFGKEDPQAWIEHTRDRPFNDNRYAIDSTKLGQLGWKQQVSFDDGLATTVGWYENFGDAWWGDIDRILSPFPNVLQESRGRPEPQGLRSNGFSRYDIRREPFSGWECGTRKRKLDLMTND